MNRKGIFLLLKTWKENLLFDQLRRETSIVRNNSYEIDTCRTACHIEFILLLLLRRLAARFVQ